MTAKEAREISLKINKDEDKVKSQLIDIHDRITKSANKGEFAVEFKNLLSGTR